MFGNCKQEKQFSNIVAQREQQSPNYARHTAGPVLRCAGVQWQSTLRLASHWEPIEKRICWKLKKVEKAQSRRVDTRPSNAKSFKNNYLFKIKLFLYSNFIHSLLKAPKCVRWFSPSSTGEWPPLHCMFVNVCSADVLFGR